MPPEPGELRAAPCRQGLYLGYVLINCLRHSSLKGARLLQNGLCPDPGILATCYWSAHTANLQVFGRHQVPPSHPTSEDPCFFLKWELCSCPYSTRLGFSDLFLFFVDLLHLSWTFILKVHFEFQWMTSTGDPQMLFHIIPQEAEVAGKKREKRKRKKKWYQLFFGAQKH